MSASPAVVAADHYAHGQAVAKTFPADVRDVLQKRSSRDPSTRFVRKLHVLLSYISANPHLEAEAGIGWVDDNVFRIFKPRLLGVLGVKLNTLNVNLKDLHFIQLQSDRTGWTRWRRDGFTRRDFDIMPTVKDNLMDAPPDLFGNQRLIMLASVPEKCDYRISHLSPPEKDLFDQHVFAEWQAIVEAHENSQVASSFFVSKAAGRYRAHLQPLQNAYDVLQAILAPQDQTHVKFPDFYRFMAMFGPGDTLMLKIHSLLEVATAGTPWLYFGTLPGAEPIVFGAFDEEEPNALVIRKGTQELDRVWNIPFIALGNAFVVDRNNQKYASWQEYFSQHPVPEETPFTMNEMDPFH